MREASRKKRRSGIASAPVVLGWWWAAGWAPSLAQAQFDATAAARRVNAAYISILTDAPDALTQDRMIDFMLVRQRVKFRVLFEEADWRGMKLSSRLLAVAHQVRKPAP